MYGRSIADTAHCTCPGQWQINVIKEKEKPAISIPEDRLESNVKIGTWLGALRVRSEHVQL